MAASSADVCLDKAKWLAGKCASKDYDEDETLSQLLDYKNSNFAGVPHSMRRKIMNEQFGRDRVDYAISREIVSIDLCYVDKAPLSDDVEFLKDFTGTSESSVDLIFLAYNNAHHCDYKCKLYTAYKIGEVLGDLVTSEIEYGNESGDWREVLSLGDRIRVFRQQEGWYNVSSLNEAEAETSDWDSGEDDWEEEPREVNVLFSEVMSKLIKWHSARTSLLLAYKVAGYRLPPELLDTIAGFYSADVEMELFAERALVDEVFAKHM